MTYKQSKQYYIIAARPRQDCMAMVAMQSCLRLATIIQHIILYNYSLLVIVSVSSNTATTEDQFVGHCWLLLGDE